MSDVSNASRVSDYALCVVVAVALWPAAALMRVSVRELIGRLVDGLVL